MTISFSGTQCENPLTLKRLYSTVCQALFTGRTIFLIIHTFNLLSVIRPLPYLRPIKISKAKQYYTTTCDILLSLLIIFRVLLQLDRSSISLSSIFLKRVLKSRFISIPLFTLVCMHLSMLLTRHLVQRKRCPSFLCKVYISHIPSLRSCYIPIRMYCPLFDTWNILTLTRCFGIFFNSR